MGLAEKVLQGNVQAAAKLMRGLEDEVPGALEELEAIYPHTGKAYILGLTGSPGVGKSTLSSALITVLRQRNMKIGVVAIDPTSPFTGGAILGDRIRMQQHSTGSDVFIRSMATRGWAGGLAKAAVRVIDVMDAMGKDIVLVETVGVGQAEVDIARVADTSVVILSPESGDEIQMIKAGILETADIFVINKADKEGADMVALGLEDMLLMKTRFRRDWKPSILMVEAINNKGVDELIEEIFKHREFMSSSGELEKCRRERAKLELMETIEAYIKNYCFHELDEGNYLEKLIADLAERRASPSAAAMKIIKRFTREFTPIEPISPP